MKSYSVCQKACQLARDYLAASVRDDSGMLFGTEDQRAWDKLAEFCSEYGLNPHAVAANVRKIVRKHGMLPNAFYNWNPAHVRRFLQACGA